MTKIASAVVLVATALTSLAAPAFAQSADRGNGQDRGDRGGRGDYFSGVTSAPITYVRGPGNTVLLRRGGAFCSTTWAALHDVNGIRNTIRHCDDRRHIDLD